MARFRSLIAKGLVLTLPYTALSFRVLASEFGEFCDGDADGEEPGFTKPFQEGAVYRYGDRALLFLFAFDPKASQFRGYPEDTCDVPDYMYEKMLKNLGSPELTAKATSQEKESKRFQAELTLIGAGCQMLSPKVLEPWISMLPDHPMNRLQNINRDNRDLKKEFLDEILNQDFSVTQSFNSPKSGVLRVEISSHPLSTLLKKKQEPKEKGNRRKRQGPDSLEAAFDALRTDILREGIPEDLLDQVQEIRDSLDFSETLEEETNRVFSKHQKAPRESSHTQKMFT